MEKYRNAVERLLARGPTHSSRKDLSPKFLYLALTLSAMISATAFSDEWRPRHALVPPTGVLNLTQPAGPGRYCFPGPKSARRMPGGRKWKPGGRNGSSDCVTRARIRSARTCLDAARVCASPAADLGPHFLDPDKNQYTVDRFLADVEGRFGPIDAVLIWPLYPNLGVDDRNQFDLIRDLPGGVSGVRHMIDQFHARGVRVFFPTLAWDTGTHDRPHLPPRLLPS